MKKIISFLLIATMLIPLLSSCGMQKKFTAYSFDYFDTVTAIIGYEETEAEFNSVKQLIFTELDTYHKLYDIYKRYDGINNLCALNSISEGEHPTLTVDQRIIDLIDYSQEIYRLTDGRVNIAMGSVLSQWHDCRTEAKSSPENARLPDLSALQAANEHTDITKIFIDRESKTVKLNDPEMKLDVGAIAKGYATERIASLLEERGITNYALNIGGNVRTIGNDKGQKPWNVGIENPNGTDFAIVGISDLSLVTSGSYQRYYTVGGKSYHHIIDAKTLFPAEGYISVSVLCRDSALADALSTALFCMSINDGKALVASLENVCAMWVSDNGSITYSSGFEAYIVK